MQVELLNTRRWSTTIELAAAMADYIDNFYNVRRRHSSLDYMSPIEFELKNRRGAFDGGSAPEPPGFFALSGTGLPQTGAREREHSA